MLRLYSDYWPNETEVTDGNTKDIEDVLSKLLFERVIEKVKIDEGTLNIYDYHNNIVLSIRVSKE